MNKRDFLDSKISKARETQVLAQAESMIPGFNMVLRINHAVRRLIFDYALIAAILGLFRFNNDVGDVLNFLALLLLNLSMAIHISRYWRTYENKKLILKSRPKYLFDIFDEGIAFQNIKELHRLIEELIS